MTLAELLARWAQLEPKRCLYSTDCDEAWFSLIFDASTLHIDIRNPTVEDHAFVQSAVQLSVEERGWLWSILYTKKGVYRAGVTMVERYMNETDRFPARAILAAYLKALELAQE